MAYVSFEPDAEGEKIFEEHVYLQSPNRIDRGQFESLCAMQCTRDEIIGFFHTNKEILEKFCQKEYNANFKEVFDIYRMGGKASLRRKQWNLADTNASIAIFLGKNILGQRDNFDVGVADMSKVDQILEEVKNSVTNE